MIGGLMLIAMVAAIVIAAWWSLKYDDLPDDAPREGLLALKHWDTHEMRRKAKAAKGAPRRSKPGERPRARSRTELAEPPRKRRRIEPEMARPRKKGPKRKILAAHEIEEIEDMMQEDRLLTRPGRGTGRDGVRAAPIEDDFTRTHATGKRDADPYDLSEKYGLETGRKSGQGRNRRRRS